jgi:inhibitor of KinA
MIHKLEPYIRNPGKVKERESTRLIVPVCYDYTVAIMGFLPGFPYLTGLNENLWTPRKSIPRAHVPKGEVGIGGSNTGIYSLPSPGGWNIIGQTPLSLFDSKKENPFFFQPGDQIRFQPISKKEYENF